MRYFDAFAGIGGFSYGIKKDIPDAICSGYAEINKYAVSIYEKHYPDHVNYGDITKIRTEELPDFDLLCGGSPCQSFSISGKRKGFEDARGTLFFEYARILNDKRPRYFLFENVKGLVNHDCGKTFQTILRIFTDIGYELQWTICNSKNFGVPQHRERIFVVGHLRGTASRKVFPFGESGGGNDEKGKEKPRNEKGISEQVCTTNTAGYNKMRGSETYIINTAYPGGIREYKETCPTITTPSGGGHLPMVISHSPRCGDPTKGGTGPLKSTEHCFTLDRTPHRVAIPVLTPNRAEKRQNGRRFKEEGEPSFTLTSQDIHGIYDGYRIRKLTSTECEKLQGFPVGWTEYGKNGELISDSQRYKVLGNAVTTNVIEAIVSRMF